ncbi:hypothetical protein DOTSEDRAFT_28830 [Dothistroma septosporum NZE10]|uniref:Uncharacterized protein n=1 Tax=Dothistroma septosporum (strain NZE10 / CBS 128990) TaxID=675120 RepID=M2XJT4_DOTSN|nr:hypothetical protein DOTSEDRAFT_28830 [Dothistroma septosporum NZE10]
MDLLSLSYDVRYLIYQQLFPSSPQIYIQALDKKLYVRLPRSQTIDTSLLRTCRQLNSEAAEFLYSNYLYNIMGGKVDCLATYETFVKALRRHANDEVHVNAFSNGDHASTMCISVHTGRGKMAMLERRGRGVPMPISRIEQEVFERQTTARMSRLMQHYAGGRIKMTVMLAFLGTLVALLAWSLTQIGVCQ